MPIKQHDDIERELSEPLNTDIIKYLDEGPAKGAPYIEGWRLIVRANEVFGHGGWTSEVRELKQQMTFMVKRSKGDIEMTVFQATVRVLAHGVFHDGVGVGIGGANASETEMAIKGAETDALKRALTKFGKQFGVELADKEEGYLYQGEQAEPAAPREAPAPAQPARAAQPQREQPQNEEAPAAPQQGEGMATAEQMDDPWSLWPPTSVAMFCQWARAYTRENSYSDDNIFAACEAFWNSECRDHAQFAANIGKTPGRIAIMRWTEGSWNIPDGEATNEQKLDPMPEADGGRN